MTRLNEKGQCPECERKPLVYKRNQQKFCARCDRAFDHNTGEQVTNFAWAEISPGVFEDQHVAVKGETS